MDVFLLGAGRPALGQRPSALKKIALNTRAMDWQIHSFSLPQEAVKLHYLGGYHVEQVIQKYPELSFTVVPGWEKGNILHTFFHAPLAHSAAIVTYSDTVFRKNVIEKISKVSEDIIFGFDSNWRNRYKSRSRRDIEIAEKIDLEDFDDSRRGEVEFTGLIYFSAKVIMFLSGLDCAGIGKNLIDLLHYLKRSGFKIAPVDVKGQWAEFNSPDDIAHFILGTKAETLDRLCSLVKCSRIGEQVNFTIQDWRQNPKIVETIQKTFPRDRLIIRSSAGTEDNWSSSNAGAFTSVLDIDSNSGDDIRSAIESVIRSYGENCAENDQVLVQKYVRKVSLAGVVFTCSLETGAPYYHFNFDDKSNLTHSVTSGAAGVLRSVVVCRQRPELLINIEPDLVPVLKAVQELEQLLSFDKLDVEFAVDESGGVHIFQVRPITIDHSDYEFDDNALYLKLDENRRWFKAQQAFSPFVFGTKSIYGNMPDWNPAEIIGTKPRPLAFSLYRQLITDETWAIQRAEFGYRDVRPCPLIIGFSGQPYVDVRASLNSFIPAALPDEVARKLAEIYLDALVENPQCHDKIEFEIAYTIWTRGFQRAGVENLLGRGLRRSEVGQLENALKQITVNGLSRLSGDTGSIEVLRRRRVGIEAENLPPLGKALTLLDDCRRYGTLAFAHAARAGFVAAALLKDFVTSGILTEDRRLEFMQSVNTVTREFEKDKWSYSQGLIKREELIGHYGHLRPGTYEITVPAYWEDPEQYIFSTHIQQPDEAWIFNLTKSESKGIQAFLVELGSTKTSPQLMEYMREAVQAREKVKFEFTRNLSRALDACVRLADELSLSREDASYFGYTDLQQLRQNLIGVDTLKERIAQRKKAYTLTQLMELPSLIIGENQFYCYEQQTARPNFITKNKVTAVIEVLSLAGPAMLNGNIILIEQADPGFDWLFGRGIAGLVTKYGGANSHMSIRAAEIGLPAAIGVGEKLYGAISKMKKMTLDCANGTIQEVI